MRNFAKQPPKEQLPYFQEAAKKMGGVDPIVTEKDFWVCWALDVIFSHPDLAPNLIFKGGTSLSKVYGVIKRFSEDIDLTIMRELVDKHSKGTSKQPGKVKERCAQAVQVHILPILQKAFSSECPQVVATDLFMDPDDPDGATVIFKYPKDRRGDDEKRNAYIKDRVKLEFGALGALEPQNKKAVAPYIVDLAELTKKETGLLTVLSIHRTFWEKVTILHSIQNAAADKTLRKEAMSRHYYDTAMMTRDAALIKACCADPALLASVVENKRENFSVAWNDWYPTATMGTMKLVPGKEHLDILRGDYEKMESEMLFGDAPTFDEVLASLKTLEDQINA